MEVPLVYVGPGGKADGRIIDCEVGRCGETVVDLGIGVDWDGWCDVHNWLGGSGWILGLQQSLDLLYSPNTCQSPRYSQVVGWEQEREWEQTYSVSPLGP